MVIDTGNIEIGGKRIKAAREDIRKLKSIMDDYGIMHIIDNVAFFSPYDAAESKERTHDGRMCDDKKDGKGRPKHGFGHRERFEFREIIIPYVFMIDFMSLTQLNHEEAEFLGDLIYGTE